MDYTKMDKEQLEAELENIGTQIDSLYSTQYNIQKIIKEREEAAYKLTNDILKVAPNGYIMAIHKQQDYHYDMYRLYKIIEVGNIGFQVIQYQYREDDGEYSLRVDKTSISNSHFHYLKNDNNLVSINPTDAEKIIGILSKLEIDYKNREEFNNFIWMCALSRIEV